MQPTRPNAAPWLVRIPSASPIGQAIADRRCITIAELRALLDLRAADMPRARLIAQLAAAGFVPGFAGGGRRRAALLLYENWLHAAVRLWAADRDCLTLEQFHQAHPDFPDDRVTRAEIRACLARLGYRRAWVLLLVQSTPHGAAV